MSQPISALCEPVRALFSDVDGTVTTAGRLEPATYETLCSLVDAGIDLILVTGRPAGWGQALLSLTPASAVVTENGGVTFIRRPGSRPERVDKFYGVSLSALAGWRARMEAALDRARQQVPGIRLSADSAYREVDLAVDWNEEVSLPQSDAERVAEILRAAGLRAVRSSVHVNFCPPVFDKLSACLAVVRALYPDMLGDTDDASEISLAPFVYVGDALNDAPAFARFPRSVGVANVRAFWDDLPQRPGYVTDEPEGAGLRALIARLLALGPSPAPASVG
ncbi:HAD-IIB family hydrolase [Haliangium ochraceum]|uniref:HAD-superfamily hydrolase, subfamily IIB n=1 Tax=Haliangium ochraceum (strain DSM 14365 / JCM 11303 / SMP-2) TaxID=502025 RepID=D0LWN4_HALO1|nr:HAD-IIB family hydrolase [Haliangium ochraceum]ACY17684.1 HAD-superfamily hydrolase, subfamily IIB [Haliangium ochraceum DSM 14365]